MKSAERKLAVVKHLSFLTMLQWPVLFPFVFGTLRKTCWPVGHVVRSKSLGLVWGIDMSSISGPRYSIYAGKADLPFRRLGQPPGLSFNGSSLVSRSLLAHLCLVCSASFAFRLAACV